MILVACGYKAPFNRLIRTVDVWAATAAPNAILAQIGDSHELPDNMRWFRHFSAHDQTSILDKTDLLICDVSIPLLLDSVDRNLPTLVLPRNPVFGEDSGLVQKRLSERLGRHPNIKVCENELALLTQLGNPVQDRVPSSPDVVLSRRTLCQAIEECISQ